MCLYYSPLPSISFKVLAPNSSSTIGTVSTTTVSTTTKANEPDSKSSEVDVVSDNNPEREDKCGDMNTNILDISNDRWPSSSSIYFDCQD